jgi:inner membrane protein
VFVSTFLADSKNIFRNSSTFKIISVGVLILLLLIPASMVQSLIAEREYRRDAVVQEINQKWGNDQLITGPFISIPFRSYYKDKKGELLHTIQYIHVLPESLDITGKIEPHVRYRSLFEAVLYNGKLDISGSFTIPSLSMLNVDSASILWHKAVISLGISDMRGIQEEVVFTLPHTVLKAGPGLLNTDIAASGVHAVLPGLSTDKQVPFSFAVNLNGSEQLQFVPVGESNTIAVQSNWKSPSFNGEFLPYERNITQSGFDAKWKVLHLNRNYPQYWVGSNYSIQSSAFGLKLILTADVYQKSTRLAKYAIMFLVFTFAAFFFSEVITKQRIHPIQYIFIGIGI